MHNKYKFEQSNYLNKNRINSLLILFVCLLLSFKINAQPPEVDTNKPLPGEGVYGFLNRHGLDAQKNFNEFITLNEGKFGANNSLLAHKTYVLPLSKTTIIEPLFGEALKEVTVTNNSLSGAIFYLIPGHGGPDPGASGNLGNERLDEDEYAYDITLRLAKCLMEFNAIVYLIIQDANDGIRDDKFLKYDTDETCMGEVIPLNQNERLKQRVDKVNDLYLENKKAVYQRSISLHLDSRKQDKQIDVFFYHYKTSKLGEELANNMRLTLEEKYNRHQPNRGFRGTVGERNLYELKFTLPTSTFIELGNIQNFRDQQRFILNSNRQVLANWLAEGIVRDFQQNSSSK